MINMLNKKRSVYLIGIGGIGISSLARWFLTNKWLVFGSDMARSVITQDLAKAGVKINFRHKNGNIKKYVDLIVYSQAINNENRDYIEAVKSNKPMVSYPQMVGL